MTKSLIAQKMNNPHLILEAVQRAVKESVLAHARAGNPVAAWKEGCVVWFQPEEDS